MINDQFNFLDQLDDMDTSSVESDSDRWRVRHFRSSSADDFDDIRYYPTGHVIIGSCDHYSCHCRQSDSVDSLTIPSPEPTTIMVCLSVVVCLF